MSLKLYMDVQARGAVTAGLRSRGVDVLTAQEDGARRLQDPEILDRAMALERVLFTQDDDLLRAVLPRVSRRVVTYGTRAGADFRITAVDGLPSAAGCLSRQRS